VGAPARRATEVASVDPLAIGAASVIAGCIPLVSELLAHGGADDTIRDLPAKKDSR
jgi:hypothetical protein